MTSIITRAETRDLSGGNAELLTPAECGLKKVGKFWYASKDADLNARGIFDRHYSRQRYADGRQRACFVGPGEKTVLLTASGDALFVWRKFISADGQKGINCAVFRNEGPIRSSDLIIDAEIVAWLRWPGERLFTYVHPGKLRSTNPGCCFKKAGWTRCGATKGGLVILHKFEWFEEREGCNP